MDGKASGVVTTVATCGDVTGPYQPGTRVVTSRLVGCNEAKNLCINFIILFLFFFPPPDAIFSKKIRKTLNKIGVA